MYKELLLFKLMIKYKNKIFLQNFKPILAENKNSMPLNIKKKSKFKTDSWFSAHEYKVDCVNQNKYKKTSQNKKRIMDMTDKTNNDFE